MTISLPERLWHNCETKGREKFFVSPDITLSYDAVAQGIRRWMASFDAAGLVPGDRFVLRTDHEPAAIIAFLAGLVDGIIPVLLEGSCPNPRLASIVSVVEPRLVISDGHLPEMPDPIVGRILKAADRPTGLLGRLGRKDTNDFGVCEKATTRAPRLPAEDGVAYLLFTSGTTSAPSGVQITRSNLAANLDTLTRLADCTDAARIFNDMILAHADGMI